MNMNAEALLQMIGKQAVQIEVLQQQLKESQRVERNGSGTASEKAAWAKETASQAAEVR